MTDSLEDANARILELMRENVKLRNIIEKGWFDAQENQWQEVRLNRDATVDEVVVSHANIHVEQMNNNSWWIGINRGDGSMMHVDFSTPRATIRCTVRNEGLIKDGPDDYGWPVKKAKMPPMPVADARRE